jgi:hypothetical protein
VKSPPRNQPKFGSVVLILMLAGALLWLHTSRRPDPDRSLRTDRRHKSESLAAIDRTVAAPSAGSGQAPTRRPKQQGEADAAHRTALGSPKPTISTLAVAAQRPAGPVLGPGLTPTAVLQNMRSVFRQYSSRFGANPVGTNHEITSALNGGNPNQVVLVDSEDGLRINERGELIDNWGTPFFFHQLSAKEMEIHSAGPDRRMWTVDDLVMK